MFSFRRRPKDTSQADLSLRASPSLPELSAQGIPWPENLVDVTVLHKAPRDSHAAAPAAHVRQQGAAKTSLHSLDRAPILFHKPFRLQLGDPTHNGTSISSLYMSHPSPAFETWRRSATPSTPTATNRRTHKKNRAPPAFNLLVVGGRGTGKTSLLRLLLDTSDISSTATAEQRASLQRFLQGELKQTQSINAACVEISESRYDRVLLTVIDTPGLDFSEGRELSVERQVTHIIRYIDQQYADTMIEESKVVRQSKGDQHIHLCIFMVDPSSILSPHARRAKLLLPRKSFSESTISSSTVTMSNVDYLDEHVPAELAMSSAELRVIRRLSERVNVLPMIARADSLTDDALAAIKEAVRSGLRGVGLDFGVFSTPMSKEDDSSSPPQQIAANGDKIHGDTDDTHVHHPNGDSHASSDTETLKERTPRPVVKPKSSRISRSRSRSCRDLSAAAHDEREPIFPEDTDEPSISTVRFSAQTLAKTDIGSLLPFAFIAPEPLSSPRTIQLLPVTPDSKPATSDEDPSRASTPVATSPTVPPESPIARRSVHDRASPEDLRGVFTRKFRWGTVDVLNPDHCDFAALRTAMLLTHMKVSLSLRAITMS
ncbi:Septin-domain-containing protein [Scleroderma citrinum]